MKKIFKLLLIFLPFLLVAQDFKSDIKIAEKVIVIEVAYGNEGSFAFKLYASGESLSDSKEFSLTLLEPENFRTLFKSKILEINNDLPENEIISKADQTFYSIMAHYLNDRLDVAPTAGVLSTKKEIPLYYDNTKHWFDGKDPACNDSVFFEREKSRLEPPKSSSPKNTGKSEEGCSGKSPKLIKIGKIVLEDITIEFLEGFAEVITVKGKLTFVDSLKDLGGYNDLHDKDITFNNIYGVGFSTQNNYDRLIRTKLFNKNLEHSDFYIRLGDVLQYRPNRRPRTRDYSPKDQVINIKGGQMVSLKKLPVNRLFEVKVFSDFLGIEVDEPNGLLQLEFDKRININHHRSQAWKHLDWLYKAYGYFQYVEPALTITKIENDGKFLNPVRMDKIVGEGENRTIQSQLSVDPISLLNHQKWSTGLDLNFLFTENSNLKYHFYADLGYRYGVTAVRDSLVELNTEDEIEPNGKTEEFNVGFNLFSFKGRLQLMPDELFNLELGYDKTYFVPTFNRLRLNTLNSFGTPDRNYQRWFNTFTMLGTVNVGERGKIFARYRFNYQSKNVENNFHQIQLGYSFYLFGNKKRPSD